RLRPCGPEDLTCPTCMGIFKDPVLLSCGHSFCKSCLHRWWTVKRTRECPVCRTQSQSRNPPPNLALKNLCESFVLERDQKASEAEEGLQELKDKLKTLKDRLKVLKEARQEYDRVTEHIKNQVRSTEKQIKTQFKKLHRFLEEEEESRIRALRDEEERKTQGVKDKMEALSREVAAVKKKKKKNLCRV
uniref:RING-type domain-containing protein n=1 Tax=Sphaeramia orbicularis TaxID=375764 RepID=A0A673CCY8_9TELE